MADEDRSMTGGQRTNVIRPLEREPGPPVLRILSWNICGSPLRDGTACRDVSPAAKVEAVRSFVVNNDINVIMLQETCLASHTMALQTALGGPDVWMRASWIARYVTADGRQPGSDPGEIIGCPNQGHDHLHGYTKEQREADGAGAAILVRRWPHDQLVKHTMEFAGTETGSPTNEEGGQAFPQGAVCIKDRRFKWMACTSHFASGDAAEMRRQSAQQLGSQAMIQRRVYGYRMVIGGDFNLQKDEEPFTTYLKPGRDTVTEFPLTAVDHILFDKAGWVTGSVEGVSLDDGGVSDHRKLFGAANRHQDLDGDHNDAVKQSKPADVTDCHSNSEVSVCWKPFGDQFWVKDNTADGLQAMVEWAASNPSEDIRYWRSGVCRAVPAADGWSVCNKDIRENTEIALRGFVFQSNGDRADWTDPFPTANTS
jgi:hypothetical protein